MAALTINHTTRSYPDLPYHEIAEAIMPRRYEISLVFVGTTRARALNQIYRSRDYIPDVLSFPLTETAGELYICLQKAQRDAPTYAHSPDAHVAFLFIHGLLHLKGYEHGATMERAERRYLARFIMA